MNPKWLDPAFVYHPADSHKAGVQEFYQRQIDRGLVPRGRPVSAPAGDSVANVEFVWPTQAYR